MNIVIKLFSMVILTVAVGLSACSAEDNQTPSSVNSISKSLYDRLGGKSAITAVVDEFVANVGADPRINGRFANTDIPHLKSELVDQICAGTGGPCTYTGKDMKTKHKDMAITDADFDALVEDLVHALDKFNVPDQEKNELLGILGPMRKDIVTA